MNLPVKTRAVLPSDMPFIYSTWLRGLYYASPFWAEVDKDLFFSTYSRVVETLVARSTVVVACLPDDDDVILGYAVAEGPVLHWVQIKEPWRKQGLAKHLVSGLSVNEVSHLTNIGNKLRKKHKLAFNPFRI